MVRVIGLLGAKGSGKDTLAKLLGERLGYVRVAFADALYREVAAAYGVSVPSLQNRETKETPLPELGLANCKDENFVQVALNVLGVSEGSRETELLAPRSPRWTLQIWGTEYRRGSEFGHDEYWVDRVRDVLETNPTTRFVVTDVRFPNEVHMVRDFEGALVRVRRPSLERVEEEARRAGDSTALHPSETVLANQPVDIEVFNREGDPLSLLEGLEEMLPELARAA